MYVIDIAVLIAWLLQPGSALVASEHFPRRGCFPPLLRYGLDCYKMLILVIITIFCFASVLRYTITTRDVMP